MGRAQVSMKTEVTWLRDMLKGDDAFELQVKLLKQVPEEYPYKDDEWHATMTLISLYMQIIIDIIPLLISLLYRREIVIGLLCSCFLCWVYFTRYYASSVRLPFLLNKFVLIAPCSWNLRLFLGLDIPFTEDYVRIEDTLVPSALTWGFKITM